MKKLLSFFNLLIIFITGKRLVNINQIINEGDYSFVHNLINSDNFPDICISRNEKLGENVSIAQFIGVDSVSKMLKILENRGYRPANIHEVAGYCHKNPEIQRTHSIVVLGSPINPKDENEKHFPCFSGTIYIKGIGLIPINSDWSNKDRNFKFAVVIKKEAK